MCQPNMFAYRHYQADIILLCLRWYLRFSLSLRDLEEIMIERGLSVDHTRSHNHLPLRRVQRYDPILEKKCRAKLKPTNNSWRVDETYVKVKGQWMYLYRAVDSTGATVEFMLQRLRTAVLVMRALPSASFARLSVLSTLCLRVLSTLTRTPLTLRLLLSEAQEEGHCATGVRAAAHQVSEQLD